MSPLHESLHPIRPVTITGLHIPEDVVEVDLGGHPIGDR
jgi:hypothetical protein